MPTNAKGAGTGGSHPVIGPLAERDLPAAESIFRVAFGTFLGVAALAVGFFGDVVFNWYSRLGA